MGSPKPTYDRTETLKNRAQRILGFNTFDDSVEKEMEKFDRILSKFKDFK